MQMNQLTGLYLLLKEGINFNKATNISSLILFDKDFYMMKYDFFIQRISNSIIYSIDIETEDLSLGILTNFTDTGWTPAEVQEIIEGVLSAKKW